MKLSAVIIAKNEERNIAACLESLVFCDERVVIDSMSEDRTAEAARAAGARVYGNEFVDYATQKNFGISKATGEWVLLIDADERLEKGAEAEIRAAIAGGGKEAYSFHRRNCLFGRWMKHGGNAGDRQLRLVRRDKAVYEGAVHETIHHVKSVGVLQSPLYHYSTPTVSDYMRKLNAYTSLEAGVMRRKGLVWSQKRDAFAAPIAVFLKRYFWQRGFLDGIEGFLFAFFSAYYESVRRLKLWELAHAGKK